MFYRLAADAVVLLHLAFILFVVFGGLLALRNRNWAMLHLPAASWGAFVEFTGRTCPLTPLENLFRARAGEAVYTHDFVARYLLPAIYPEGLTREAQIVLGIGVLLLNLVIYLGVLKRFRRN